MDDLFGDSAQRPPRLCPCCDEPLPLGLFAHEPRALLPQAVLDMHNSGFPVGDCYEETIITAAERWFVACRSTLPMDWDDSPVTVGVWVEVDRVDRKSVV